jgi:hypothetical protein
MTNLTPNFFRPPELTDEHISLFERFACLSVNDGDGRPFFAQGAIQELLAARQTMREGATSTCGIQDLLIALEKAERNTPHIFDIGGLRNE